MNGFKGTLPLKNHSDFSACDDAFKKLEISIEVIDRNETIIQWLSIIKWLSNDYPMIWWFVFIKKQIIHRW